MKFASNLLLIKARINKLFLLRSYYMKKIMVIIGNLLIGFAILDFILSYFGINLTPFLPNEIARLSPIIFGVLGLAITKANWKE
jgi:hypothetical protein